MHITPATLEDARQVAEIHVATWQSAYQGILPAEYLASLSVDKREAMWRESIVKGAPQLFVAKVEGAMVGWVAFGPCRDAGSPPDFAEVWAIYVAPPSWSSGVGRRLWHRSQARMLEQGFKTVSAWVFTQNARAIKFYRAAGFAPDLSSVKEFELGGKQLQEIRYTRALE
jgi:L-amino acid N-acyltransferase YncA